MPLAFRLQPNTNKQWGPIYAIASSLSLALDVARLPLTLEPTLGSAKPILGNFKTARRGSKQPLGDIKPALGRLEITFWERSSENPWGQKIVCPGKTRKDQERPGKARKSQETQKDAKKATKAGRQGHEGQ